MHPSSQAVNLVWLRDGSTSATLLARDLAAMGASVRARAVRSIDALDTAARQGADCILVPLSGPTTAMHRMPSTAPVLAFGTHATVADEQVWLAAGALGTVEVGQPKRLLRAIHRAATLHARHRERRPDTLTALGTRAALLDELRTPTPSRTLVVLDVVDFAGVNDAFGHAAGDALLRHLAVALSEVAAGRASLFRTGSDEFAALFSPALDADAQQRLVTRLHAELGRSVLVDGAHVTPHLRVGVAHGSGNTGARLLRDAAGARAHARPDQSTALTFDGTAREQRALQLRLRHDFRRALSRNEFWVAFQPILSMSTGQVTGFEALARWTHPELGPISPGVFVPVAEQSGLITELGRWILQEACAHIRRWRTAIPELAGATVNVNLSPDQLADERLADGVAEALSRHALDPSALRLELTENRGVGGHGAARERLDALRALGVELHLDDFGTGHANLQHLLELPVDGLKLDRSLVMGIDTDKRRAAMLEGTLAMARSLGMSVVAEGIERPEEHAFLVAAGVESGQGYLFSPPMPAREVPSFVASLRGVQQR